MAAEGVSAIPNDSNSARFWGAIRRQLQRNFSFPASTTTPFSGNSPAGVLIWDAKMAYNGSASATPTGELELDDIRGLTVIIANNASGQTLSGVTLEDYDKLPTSGLLVPNQSYTMATNAHDGSSATLSSLSLANNAAIRLYIPLTNGSLRQLYLNPTYAAAVTSGTGSLEVMVIPDFMGVQQFGSIAPDAVEAPVTLGPLGNPGFTNPIDYSHFTTAEALYVTFGSVNANAKKRLVLLKNTMDQAVTMSWTGACIQSFSTGLITQNPGSTLPSWLVPAGNTNTQYATIDSGTYPVVLFGDCFEVKFTVSTDPTTGSLEIAAAEVL